MSDNVSVAIFGAFIALMFAWWGVSSFRFAVKHPDYGFNLLGAVLVIGGLAISFASGSRL